MMQFGEGVACLRFLKYDVQLPQLQDFTLCLWFKTLNFTYPHPLFSYSKDEKERLIRSWLTPPPFPSIHLEVLGHEVMDVAMHVETGRWYQVCQAWSGSEGKWGLHVNGRLRAAGDNWQVAYNVLRGLRIPGGGDVVVGQEYTDFDKGLDDGIEGEVFGFNLVRGAHLRPSGRPHGNELEVNPPDHELIVRSYGDCVARRGAPVSDKRSVLVSWTRTPVAVFGGAVIAEARPVCGDF
uniref:Pentraxin (PTX) domain-containing protein n=1 Tax=Timema monikensis TaxID=170555 RepID=A0A7R9HS81_9NEOP|nr:unnamed protein product [Timema monikensis]